MTAAVALASIHALVLLAANAPVRDAAWARSLPDGASIVLPAGRYVGPWHFTHRIRMVAEPGATLVPGGEDPGHATLTLQQGGQIEGLVVEAPPDGYAVRVERSSATLARLHFSGKGTAGLYFVASKLEVTACDFEGNQYGILSEGPSTLELQESSFHGVYRAGVALVSTAANLKANVFVGPFFEAAVAAIHCDPISLTDTRITVAGEIGLKFVTSKAVIENAQVEGVRRDTHGLEGNGLYSYQSTLEVNGLKIADTDGVGVAVSGGRVTLRRCEVRHCSEVAANVTGGGALRADDCVFADTPVGIFVDPDGTAEVSSVRYERVQQHRFNAGK